MKQVLTGVTIAVCADSGKTQTIFFVLNPALVLLALQQQTDKMHSGRENRNGHWYTLGPCRVTPSC